MSKVMQLIEEIKSNKNFPDKNPSENFPDKNARDSISVNLFLVVKYLTLVKNKSKFADISFCSSDYEFIEKKLVEHFYEYVTEKKITFKKDTMHIAHRIISPHHAFHTAMSRIFRNSYEETNFRDEAYIYDFFSIPFTIRLAIEKKIKKIIGFKYVIDEKYNRKIHSIPITKVINCLQKNLTKIPNPLLSDIKEVYKWGCGFTHTGRREYIWFVLEALQCIAPLFIYEQRCRYKNHKFSNSYLNCSLEELCNLLSRKIYKNKKKVILNSSNFENDNAFWWEEKKINL